MFLSIPLSINAAHRIFAKLNFKLTGIDDGVLSTAGSMMGDKEGSAMPSVFR